MSAASARRPSRAEAQRALGSVARDRGWTVARGFHSRLVGWIGRRRLPADAGLCLVPCRAIHTFGMRFAIDAVFVDRRLRIVRCVADLPPRRIAGDVRAFAVIELPAGAASRIGLKPGEALFPIDPHTQEIPG